MRKSNISLRLTGGVRLILAMIGNYDRNQVEQYLRAQ